MNHEIQSLLDQRVIEKYTSLNDADFTSYNINDEVIGTAGSVQNSGNGSFGFSQIQAQLFPNCAPMSSSNSPSSTLQLIDTHQISNFNTPTLISNQSYQQPISPPQSLPQQFQIQNNQQYDNSYNVPSPSQDSFQQQQQQQQQHINNHHSQHQHSHNSHQLHHHSHTSSSVPSNTILTIHSNSFQHQIQHQPLSPQQQIPSIISNNTNNHHYLDNNGNNNNNYNIVPIHHNNNNLNHSNGHRNNASLGGIIDYPSSPQNNGGSSIPTSPYLSVDDHMLLQMNRSQAQFQQMYNGKIETNFAEDELKRQTKKRQTKSASSKKDPYTTSTSVKLNAKEKEMTQKEKSLEKCRKAIELHKKNPPTFCSEPKIEFLPRDLIPEPNSVTNNHIITPPTVIKLNLPTGYAQDYSNFWVTARLTEKDKFKIDYTKEHFDWDGYCSFNIKIEKPKGNEKTDFFKIRYDLFTEDADGNPKYLGNIVSNNIRYCYHTSSLPNPKIEFCSPSFINTLSKEPTLELYASFFKHGEAHPLIIIFVDQHGNCVYDTIPSKSSWTSEWSININTPSLPPGSYRIFAVYSKKNESFTPQMIKQLLTEDSCEIYYSDNTTVDSSLINNYSTGGGSNGNSGSGPNGRGGSGPNGNSGSGPNGNSGSGPNNNNNSNNNNNNSNNGGGGYGGSGGNFYYQYSVNIADTTNNQFYRIYKEISNCSTSDLSKYETFRNIVNETTGDSLLMYSILLNDKSTFNKLLMINTKLSIMNNAHFNALHYAAYASPNDNNEFFTRLVTHYEQKNQDELRAAVFSSNQFGKYLVHMLAELRSTSNLLMILNKYPQVFGVQDARGNIPLHYMIMHADESAVSSLVDLWEKYSKSASSNNLTLEEREDLIDSITLQSYNHETNALHLACAIGSVKMVNRLLNVRQFDLYEQDSDEEYCIHKAIANRKYDVIRLLQFIGFDSSLVMEEMKELQADLEISEDEGSFIARCQLGSIPKSYSVVDIQVDSVTASSDKEESIDNIENDVNTNDLINRLLTLSHSDSSESSSITPSSSSSSSSSSRNIPPVSSTSNSSSHLPRLISEAQTSGNTTTYTFGSSNKRLDQIIEQLAQKIRNLETTNKTLEKKINEQDRQRDPSDPTEETYLDAINRFVKKGGVYQRQDRKTGKIVELSSDTLNAFKDNCKSLPSSVIGKIISQTEKDDKLIVDVDFYFEQV